MIDIKIEGIDGAKSESKGKIAGIIIRALIDNGYGEVSWYSTIVEKNKDNSTITNIGRIVGKDDIVVSVVDKQTN